MQIHLHVVNVEEETVEKLDEIATFGLAIAENVLKRTLK